MWPRTRAGRLRAWSGVIVLAALAVVGCARTPVELPRAAAPPPPPPREELYVVVPTGAVNLTHAGQERLLETPYAAARISEAGRLDTGVASEQEVRAVFGEALGALPAAPISFIFYFVERTDELTPESRGMFAQVSAEIARRPAPEIAVIGHTDRVGSVSFNDALALRRAERMKRELTALGIPAERIQVSGRGEREPLVPTEDEVAEPRNRRVEVSVR